MREVADRQADADKQWVLKTVYWPSGVSVKLGI
jgi:hypothetical protein